MKLPAHRGGPGNWGGRLTPGNPSLLQGSPQPRPASLLWQPHHAGRGDAGYSWSIFSLHQNNLTADGRRPPPRSSSPWRVKVHTAPRDGAQKPQPREVLGGPVPGSWSKQWLDRRTPGGEGTQAPH